MTAREVAACWLIALVYTGFVVGVAFLFPWLLGDVLGGVVAFVVALVPVVAMTFLSLR